MWRMVCPIVIGINSCGKLILQESSTKTSAQFDGIFCKKIARSYLLPVIGAHRRVPLKNCFAKPGWERLA